MTPLSEANLHRLPPAVLTPAYDRKTLTAGIAHIGVGNFHKAHQALYVDRLLGEADQKDWGIVGIGVRAGQREEDRCAAFHAQDNLYTLTEFSPNGETKIRTIGSIVEYVSCLESYETVIRRLADPSLRIVTLTITEGGYFVGADGAFLRDHPAIVEDLTRPVPETAFGVVTEALRLRRESGAGPFTILSCDNLQQNGRVAQTAFCGYAKARDPSLGAWIEENVTFPSCMVDRIAPSVSDADVARLDEASGVGDRMPVYSEDFIQWVVEDRFCAGRPPFELVGVEMRDDVTGYEQVKLRMLNAGHSVVALSGLLMGFRRVDEAVNDPRIAALVEQFLTQDVAPLLSPPSDVDLSRYAASVLHRFRNGAVGDQLVRIASDSFSKLPTFWGPTVQELLRDGRDVKREAFALACWAECEGAGRDEKGQSFLISEPAASEQDKAVFLSEDILAPLSLSVVADWGVKESAVFRALFGRYRTAIREQGASSVLKAL